MKPSRLRLASGLRLADYPPPQWAVRSTNQPINNIRSHMLCRQILMLTFLIREDKLNSYNLTGVLSVCLDGLNDKREHFLLGEVSGIGSHHADGQSKEGVAYQS
jgi:hypothetical protein